MWKIMLLPFITLDLKTTSIIQLQGVQVQFGQIWKNLKGFERVLASLRQARDLKNLAKNFSTL